MRSLSVAALFAGIGGLDLGLEKTGHCTEFMSEWDPVCSVVLRKHFPNATHVADVREIKTLPKIDLVTAGFPCQDISLAGTKAGLLGARSGLINEVFRLISKRKPEFVLIENVLNLLRLQSGEAMVSILRDLEVLGYRWAYRVVDSRGFGLPQRRQRVVILASRGEILPQNVLFSIQKDESIDDRILNIDPSHVYGFYWTEGKRGIGWAVDAVPTIKGGSGLGIPSPPAIFDPNVGIAGTPTIRDAERLQGFRSDWTRVQVDGMLVKEGARWKMVGNAVSVPLSRWLGKELSQENFAELSRPIVPLDLTRAMPKAAFGDKKTWWTVESSLNVLRATHMPIQNFLLDPVKPLSARALEGYLSRVASGDKNLPKTFIKALKRQAQISNKYIIEPFYLN